MSVFRLNSLPQGPCLSLGEVPRSGGEGNKAPSASLRSAAPPEGEPRGAERFAGVPAFSVCIQRGRFVKRPCDTGRALSATVGEGLAPPAIRNHARENGRDKPLPYGFFFSAPKILRAAKGSPYVHSSFFILQSSVCQKKDPSSPEEGSFFYALSRPRCSPRSGLPRGRCSDRSRCRGGRSSPSRRP